MEYWEFKPTDSPEDPKSDHFFNKVLRLWSYLSNRCVIVTRQFYAGRHFHWLPVYFFVNDIRQDCLGNILLLTPGPDRSETMLYTEKVRSGIVHNLIWIEQGSHQGGPEREKGFEMVCERIKPCYSDQAENGVLYFVAPGKNHGELCGMRI